MPQRIFVGDIVEIPSVKSPKMLVVSLAENDHSMVIWFNKKRHTIAPHMMQNSLLVVTEKSDGKRDEIFEESIVRVRGIIGPEMLVLKIEDTVTAHTIWWDCNRSACVDRFNVRFLEAVTGKPSYRMSASDLSVQ